MRSPALVHRRAAWLCAACVAAPAWAQVGDDACQDALRQPSPPQALALAAAALMLVDALLSHPFWSLAEPGRSAQLLHFRKNACMVGGLLLLSLVAPVARRR